MQKPESFDLTTFGKTKPFNVNDLRHFAAADVDPYTVQLGQILCERFSFAQQGHRNLASAFDSLPSKDWVDANFEVGYGEHHILHTVLKSDAGSNLAAIVGALAEYFCEDVAVQFLILLASKSDIPHSWRSLEHQLTRLVQVLCGVLSTSTLGLLFSSVEEKLPPPKGAVQLERLVNALHELSSLSKSRGKAIKLTVGAELVWLVSIAQWLFDLKVGVVSEAANLIYTSSGVTKSEEADVLFQISSDSTASKLHSLSLSESSTPLGNDVSGGRVPYESLFRSTFGQHFLSLGEETTSAYICSASAIFSHTLSQDPDPMQKFIHRTGADSAGALLETLIIWFPELRKLSSRCGKYTKLSLQDAKKAFDKAHDELERQCSCSRCIDGPSPDNDDICAIRLTEFIVNLGLRIVKRMTVSSKLYPKKGGVLALYRRHEAIHPPKPANITPSDHFIQTMATKPASFTGMLRSATLLFSNSISKEIERQKDLMGITHHGLCVFTTGLKEVTQADKMSPKTEVWTTTIQVMPGWMCLFGHEAQMEVYEKTHQDLDFEQQFRTAVSGGQWQQIMKWKGRIMLSSLVLKGSEEAKRRFEEGWALVGESENK